MVRAYSDLSNPNNHLLDTMDSTIIIRNVGISYVSNEYHAVALKVAQRLGFSSVDQLFTYNYCVVNEQATGHTFAYFAFASLLKLLDKDMAKAGLKSEEVLKYIFIHSSYNLDSEPF